MSTEHKGIHYYTAFSPNPFKTNIFFEELKAAYGLEYSYQALDLSKQEQKEPWYIEINPNGRVPAIIDHNNGDFKVFESAAILLYLAGRYDKDHKFSFEAGSKDESEALQWILFSHGGVGPMQGQSSHFALHAPEKIEYAINRYSTEIKRIYSVLESRLKDRDYLTGPGRGTYSIADINAFPWIWGFKFAPVDSLDEWPALKAWMERINARPQVQSGLSFPPMKWN